MVSGFDNVHIRVNISRLEEALQYGQSAGDRSVHAYAIHVFYHLIERIHPQDLHKLCSGLRHRNEALRLRSS